MARLIDADEMRENLLWCKPQSSRYDNYWDDVIERLDVQPTVNAVPVHAISVWLAAYAAPPKYALDEIAGTDPGRIVTVDTLVKAWEYHWKNLMECGLIGDGADAEAEK